MYYEKQIDGGVVCGLAETPAEEPKKVEIAEVKEEAEEVITEPKKPAKTTKSAAKKSK